MLRMLGALAAIIWLPIGYRMAGGLLIAFNAPMPANAAPGTNMAEVSALADPTSGPKACLAKLFDADAPAAADDAAPQALQNIRLRFGALRSRMIKNHDASVGRIMPWI